MEKKSDRKSSYIRQETWKKRNTKQITPRVMKKGFTLAELGLIVLVIGVFFAAGAFFLRVTSKSAYDITVKHDLQKFADFQDYHYKINRKCLGEQGQSVRNDGVPSDLVIENYSVSEGVCITIVAGDPQRPNDADNPYAFQARHAKSDKVYEYNFLSGKTVER